MQCKKEKKRKEKNIYMFKTLYKSYLMNVGITSLQGELWGRQFLILDLKISTLSQHFNSDGTISHIFGLKNLKELDP